MAADVSHGAPVSPSSGAVQSLAAVVLLGSGAYLFTVSPAKLTAPLQGTPLAGLALAPRAVWLHRLLLVALIGSGSWLAVRGLFAPFFSEAPLLSTCSLLFSLLSFLFPSSPLLSSLPSHPLAEVLWLASAPLISTLTFNANGTIPLVESTDGERTRKRKSSLTRRALRAAPSRDDGFDCSP